MQCTRLSPLAGCVVGVWLGICAQAQTPAPATPAVPGPAPVPAAAAAANRSRPVVSPELLADGRVAFRLRAPEAKEVGLRGQWTRDRLTLTRDEGGVWELTVGPVPAGVWEYSFVVDGVTLLDPGNPVLKPMREPRTSIVHVPGTPPNPWDFQDLPHGTVHQHAYASKALGRPRELWVYTPPGYERAGERRYPLLVLQHGSGDNQATWVVHGKAHWILDSLIAQGKARPMLVLMIDGHPLGNAPAARSPAGRAQTIDAFRRELFEDALPLVEGLYRVEPGPEARAIAGLSMGGGQSLSVGLASLDRFGWIGAFSSAPPVDELVQPALVEAARSNAQLRLLWIACGRDDFLRSANEQFVARLKEAKLEHEWHLTAGDHSWPVWRRYLVDFLPRLFPR